MQKIKLLAFKLSTQGTFQNAHFFSEKSATAKFHYMKNENEHFQSSLLAKQKEISI